MNRGLAALAGAAVLFVSAVVVTVLTRPERTIVHDRPVVTTPIVSSPVTPLPRDSGPKNNARKKTYAKHVSQSAARNKIGISRPNQPETRRRRPLVKTRPTPRPKAKPQNGSQGGSQSPQTQPSAPQPQRPPSTVEINPPVGPTVCNPLVSIRCP